MSLIEALAVIFGLVYIYFSINNRFQGFLFAIVSCSLWAYADFVYFNYKFDGFLQIFYVVMAIIGITKWRSQSSRQELLISSLSSTQHAIVILSGILLTVLCVNILKIFASSDYIWLDGFTTVFSIIATFLLIYRKIDNWIYFFVCNLIYIYLFYLKSAIGFSGLMLVYTILSVIGFINWRKLMSIEMTHGKQLIKD